MNILAATAPASLRMLLPDNAFDHGFMSRVIIVYADKKMKRNLFDETFEDGALERSLLHDLRIMADDNFYGRMVFEDEVRKAIALWDMSGGKPAPTHPKLTNYNERRTAHLLKLCMIAAVSNGNSLTITMKDYQEALGWLLEVEAAMESVFKAMTTGGDYEIMKEIWHWLFSVNQRNQGAGITESVFIQFVQSLVPAHNVERFVTIMVKAGMITKKLDAYFPLEWSS